MMGIRVSVISLSVAGVVGLVLIASCRSPPSDKGQHTTTPPTPPVVGQCRVYRKPAKWVCAPRSPVGHWFVCCNTADSNGLPNCNNTGTIQGGEGGNPVNYCDEIFNKMNNPWGVYDGWGPFPNLPSEPPKVTGVTCNQVIKCQQWAAAIDAYSEVPGRCIDHAVNFMYCINKQRNTGEMPARSTVDPGAVPQDDDWTDPGDPASFCDDNPGACVCYPDTDDGDSPACAEMTPAQ